MNQPTTTTFLAHKTGGEFKFDHDSPEFRRLSLNIDDSALIEPSALGNDSSAATGNQLPHAAFMIVSGTNVPMQPQPQPQPQPQHQHQHQHQNQQQQQQQQQQQLLPPLQSRDATVSAANNNGVSSSALSSSSSSPSQPLSATAASSLSGGTAAGHPLFATASSQNGYQLHSQAQVSSAVPIDAGVGPIQLWMGDIEPWMDDERICQIWACVGEPMAVKMIRDRLTGGPANYCFLEFSSQTEAERILATYNGKPMPLPFDRPFRLNWASGVGAGYGSPFLPLGLASGSGYSQQQGRSYLLGIDGTGSGNNAILNTATTAPAPATAAAAPPPSSHTAFAAPTLQATTDGPEYSLFVGDLASEVTDVQLAHEFRCRYSSVRAAKVVTDPITLLPRGYGFVRFSDENDQQRALIEMQGHLIGSRAIRVSTATPKRTSSMISTSHNHSHSLQHGAPSREAAGSPTSSASSADSNDMYNPATDPFNTTVFVGGLTHPVGEDELYAFFAVYGEVTYCKIPPNRGCGFVTYAKRANAEAAIRALNGHMLGGSRVRLSWGRSQSHARHNHRHNRHHSHHPFHRNSSGGGSSGVTSHRNSVSEQQSLMNRRSVSMGKSSAASAAITSGTNATANTLGLGLSGASIAGIGSSTPASTPVKNTLQSDAFDLKPSPTTGMATTQLASLQTPVSAHPNSSYLGGMPQFQQQQQQQQQQFMNGYNMTPQSSLYMLSPANMQGAVFNIDAFGADAALGDISKNGMTGTSFPHPFPGYSQQMYGYYQNQNQNQSQNQHQQQQLPEHSMLATPVTAHGPGLNDSPLLSTHFTRQHQQPQQGLSLRSSGQFDNLYPLQQNQQPQEYRDTSVLGSGTALPSFAASSGDLLTRRLSALSLGNTAARSRPNSLIENQPPALGSSTSAFSTGNMGGIGGNLTPTGGGSSSNLVLQQHQHLQYPQQQQPQLQPQPQQQQQQQPQPQQHQQSAHPPSLDRRPSAGVIGQRKLSSKPSFQHQLQPQRSLSQISMTQLWQPSVAATGATNNASMKGSPVDLGGPEVSSSSQPTNYAGLLNTPAMSMKPSSSSLSLMGLSPSGGGEGNSNISADNAYFCERSSGESTRKLPTPSQKYLQ